MKILLIAHGLPPQALGGTEVYTRDIAHGLAARGHDVTVLFRDASGEREDGSVSWGAEGGVRTVGLANAYTGLDLGGDDYVRTYNNPRLAEPFRAVLGKTQPDIAHFTYALGGLGANLLGEAAYAGARVIVTLTDYHLLCPWGQLLTPDNRNCDGPQEGAACVPCFRGEPLEAALPGGRMLAPLTGLAPKRWVASRSRHPALRAMYERLDYLRAMVGRADTLLAPTRELAYVFEKTGFPNARWSPLAIDVSRFNRREQDEMPQDPIRLGFIGCFRAHKGLHVLMDALTDTVIPKGGVTLDVLGDARSPEERAYRDALPGADRARVRFRGALPVADMPKFFEEIDLLVIPSLWRENAPLVTHYCRAACVPAIYSDVPGLKEPLGEGGWAFPVGNAGSLASLIALVVRNPGEVTSRRGCMFPVPDFDEHLDELEGVYGGADG